MKKYKNLQYLTTVQTSYSKQNPYGDFNLALHVGDDMQSVMKNRKKLQLMFGSENEVVFPNQVHGSKIGIVDSNECSFDEHDALITNIINQPIAVLTADCIPAIVYDEVKKVIAVVHAGWRGVQNKILLKTIDKMMNEFGSQINEINVFLGPCISKSNYEVGKDVYAKFLDEEYKDALEIKQDKAQLDIRKIQYIDLINKGVEKIQVSEICTFDDQKYYSARRDGLESGRFATVAMLTN